MKTRPKKTRLSVWEILAMQKSVERAIERGELEKVCGAALLAKLEAANMVELI